MTEYPWEAAPTGTAAGIAAAAAFALTRLQTARLVLRPARIGDFQLYAAIVAEADAPVPDEAARRRDTWCDFSQMVAGWLLHGHGLFAIERRGNGMLVGFIPLNHECGDPEREIGWFLSPAATGRGYATEAAAAVRRHAFATLGCTTLVSYVAPDNLASRAVAERLGAVCEPGLQDGCLVFRHHPSEAPA